MFGNDPDHKDHKNNNVLEDLHTGITEFFESVGEESKETLTQARDFLREKLEEMDDRIKDYDENNRSKEGGSTEMSDAMGEGDEE